jgi:predicted glutamine amidotransferase
MCQLLGMNCNVPTDIVFSFTGFAHRGGRTDEHKDGWGIAFFEGAGVRLFVDHESAVASPVAELIKSYPIKSKNVIAHIRKATQGQVALENCHPFIRELWGRYWVFAHNGDLKEFSPTLDGAFRPVGTTTARHAAARNRSTHARNRQLRRFQHDAVGWHSAIRALLNAAALYRSAAPIHASQTVGRRSLRRFFGSHHTQGSGSRNRYRTAHH